MIKIFPDIEELNHFAAKEFVRIANQAIDTSDYFAVALAGGSTPKSLYRLLASENFKNQIEWSKVFFFFGDERNVPPDDAESNFRMANENLFNLLQISGNQIFAWHTNLRDAEEIAKAYEAVIKEFFALAENEFPRFDLILLGMGADGHTASLFPYSPALGEIEKIAAANPVAKFGTNRLTFTYPTIDNAANVMFLVGGAEKAEALREVLEGDFQPGKFPSQNVKPHDGNLLWLVDRKAARLLQ
ncbi:MAG TPA: 6-phosphogluconolactonase [Pyrinomonadaceae bacterium]|jgi:6-phosphogluconolactonase